MRFYDDKLSNFTIGLNDMEFFNIPYYIDLPYLCNITILLHSFETEDRETCVVNVYPNFLPLVS